MINGIKNQKVNIKVKNIKNNKNKLKKKIYRGNIFESPLPNEIISPSKLSKNVGKRNNKTNSFSSLNQNKTEMNTKRLKEKIEYPSNLEYNMENKRLNNYLKNKNLNK